MKQETKVKILNNFNVRRSVTIIFGQDYRNDFKDIIDSKLTRIVVMSKGKTWIKAISSIDSILIAMDKKPSFDIKVRNHLDPIVIEI